MNRISKAVSLLHQFGSDALLIVSEENMHYFCGFSPSEGMILITKDGVGHHFVDSRYTVIAKRGSKSNSLKVIEIETGFYQEVSKIVSKHGIKSLAIEDEKITLKAFEEMKEKIPCSFCNLGDKLTKLRSVKDQSELKLLIKAQEIADKSFLELLNHIKAGKTEKELAALFEYIMLQNGSDGASFGTILISGKNTSMPHGVPSEKKIEDGDFVTLDFGATFMGYHSDATRTVAVQHCTEEMAKVYNTVLEAQIKALDFISAGKECKTAHDVALKVIEKNGYGTNFRHGLGHGVGIEIHESPRTSPFSSDIFEVGNVTSVEPGIYLPEKFGVRIEDVIFIDKNQNINLTKLPKDLLVL